MREKEVFVFDVDGTLTDSRQPISPQFLTFMLTFCKDNDVYLVTGSDRRKTFEQIGPILYESVKGVWQCNGNEYWEKSRRVSQNEMTVDYEFKSYLDNIVQSTRYPIKTGNHIEKRTGMINFSIPGRDSNDIQRQQYFDWDSQNHERSCIVKKMNHDYPKLHASIGGMISIDISPRGNNKSQIADILNKQYETIHFFGDRMEFGGNDYPLALTIELGKMGKTYPVTGWEQTWELLNEKEN